MTNERSLLERARRGFVHHLCDNGVISPGLTCLACEIDALLRAPVEPGAPHDHSKPCPTCGDYWMPEGRAENRGG
jgi:hypothetical protein